MKQEYPSLPHLSSSRAAGARSRRVRPRQKAKCALRQKKLGYTPNRYAQAVRTGRSKAVILAINPPHVQWGMDLSMAVRDRARTRGLTTLVLPDDTWAEFLGGYPADAAFITGIDGEPQAVESLRAHAKDGLQLVAFSERLAPEGFDVVCSSSLPAARDAYMRLRERHPRVSVLARSVPSDVEPRHPSRSWALMEAAREIGDCEQSLFLASPVSVSDAFAEFLALLARPDRPTAVVALDRRLGHAMAEAALVRGLRVPDDLEVIEVPLAPTPPAPDAMLSTYTVPDIHRRLSQVILRRALEGKDAEYQHVSLPWEFSPGSTSKDSMDATGADMPMPSLTAQDLHLQTLD